MSAPDLDSVFAPAGLLSRSHPAYEPRPGQVQMARAVARSLESGHHLLVEAGTGTGKTLAYLVPAALSGLRVVVSTGTKTLQDQIIDRDIPFIRERLGIPVTATAMKGRDNYLCLRRLRDFEAQPLLESLDETAPWKEVRRWASRTAIGDRAELPGLPDDASFWRAINARGDTCTGTRCADYEDCFLTQMKRRAARSEIIVVNHHLFFADLALRQDAFGRIIPDHDRVIFDEAHLIEEVATRYFGLSLSSHRIEELADDADRVITALRRPRREGFVRESDLEERDRAARRARGGRGRKRGEADEEGTDGSGARGVAGETRALRRASRELFSLFGGNGPQRAPFIPERMRPGLDRARERLATALERLASAVMPLTSRSEEAVVIERRALEIAGLLRVVVGGSLTAGDTGAADDPGAAGRVVTTTSFVGAAEPGDGLVRWWEKHGRGLFLHAAPIDVSGHLAEMLFGPSGGVVLTSATLSVGGEFTFVRDRLGLFEADELLVSSPFDYETQTVLYLPDEMPDPRNDGFIDRLTEEVLDLIGITRGRAFLLFTSFANLARAREALERRAGYPLITQGEGPKAALIERFRSTPGAVLLGTSSFWHGVDVQGEALSLVVIDKLPFDVPGDPLVAARIDRINTRGGNAFAEYQVPSAVIALKQGLGRLIRSSRDRGVLAVLDPRLRTKSYGRVFLESLPPFPVVRSIDSVARFFDAGDVEGSPGGECDPPAGGGARRRGVEEAPGESRTVPDHGGGAH